MTTSGTVGQTVIDVTTIIEHAYRRCGKLASTISGELQLSARNNLFFLLSDLANRGLSLWCVTKRVLGTLPDNAVYDLPVGTVDVLNALYRTQTTLTGSTLSGAGYQGLDLGSGAEAAVSNVAVRFTAAATPTLVVEGSSDGVTWVQYAAFTPASAVTAGAWLCCDVDNSAVLQYWRVRDTSGTLPAVTALTFNNDAYEVPMYKLSRDDYVALPNKTFAASSSSKSLQFWYDKQAVQPRLWVWPVTSGSTGQFVVWTQRHIEDVGDLSNSLDVPQRWLESVILTLACRCAVELPAGELPDGRLQYLESKAAEHLAQAEDGESDGAPIRIVPRIGGYTR